MTPPAPASRPGAKPSEGEGAAGPNPLAAALERLPVHATALVIFGATGDLARRKLLPALSHSLSGSPLDPQHP